MYLKKRKNLSKEPNNNYLPQIIDHLMRWIVMLQKEILSLNNTLSLNLRDLLLNLFNNNKLLVVHYKIEFNKDSKYNKELYNDNKIAQ